MDSHKEDEIGMSDFAVGIIYVCCIGGSIFSIYSATVKEPLKGILDAFFLSFKGGFLGYICCLLAGTIVALIIRKFKIPKTWNLYILGVLLLLVGIWFFFKQPYNGKYCENCNSPIYDCENYLRLSSEVGTSEEGYYCEKCWEECVKNVSLSNQ